MKIKEILESLINSKNRVDYIVEYLSSLKINFNLQNYQKRFVNIEVAKSYDKNKKDIIFFAHHDISNKTLEGANDNSSSVAVMLKIATILEKINSNYNIKIVFNDNEELLGGLYNNYDRIIHLTGSYQYIKNYKNKERIEYVIILELSGIGDSIFISNNSGSSIADSTLNSKLEKISSLCSLKLYKIDIPPSDLYCINTFNLKGTVVGAIPSIQAEYYIKNRNNTPPIWKNIHSDKDNIFAINEKSLDMVYNFIKSTIEKID